MPPATRHTPTSARYLDECPGETKTQPGFCGCSVSEVDSDSDGTPDCVDLCPNDGTKTAPGDCGCVNAPESAGTSCSAVCPASTTCDGAGTCGAPTDCETVVQSGIPENTQVTLNCTSGVILSFESTYGSNAVGSCPVACGSCTIGNSSCTVHFDNANCGDCAPAIAKTSTLELYCFGS